MNSRRLSPLLVAIGLLGLLFLAERVSQADGWIVRSETILDELHRCQCQDNLRQIEKATRQWMFDNRKRLDAVPQWSDLVGATKYLASQPACPAGGSYTLAGGGDYPGCTLETTDPWLHAYTSVACTDPADKTARAHACRDNLEVLRAAKLKFVVDHHLPLSLEPTWDDLIGPDKYIKTSPVCPSGGVYAVNDGYADPFCSLWESEEHNLGSDYDGSPTEDKRRGECQKRLRMIEEAKQGWAKAFSYTTGDDPTPAWTDLVGGLSFLHASPSCPDGGTYTINPLSVTATCSLEYTAPYLHIYSDAAHDLSHSEARAACQERLRAIREATSRWMVDNRKTPQDVPEWSDLVGYGKYLRHSPECAGGGVYTLSSADGLPTCSLSGDPEFPHGYSLVRSFLASQEDCEADRRGGCQENMRAIHEAKQLLAKELHLAGDATPTWEQLVGTGLYLPVMPVCPVDGVYTIGTIDEKPSCSLASVAPYLHEYTVGISAGTHPMIWAIEVARLYHCQRNQVVAFEAVRKWAEAVHPAPSTEPTWGELLQGGYLEEIPVCLTGGTYEFYYTQNPLHPVRCSLASMVLFPHEYEPRYPDTCTLKDRLNGIHWRDAGDLSSRVALCRTMLKAIVDLKERWADATNAPDGAIPTSSTLLEFLECDFTLCFNCLDYCPTADGDITISPVSDPPHCTVESRAFLPHGINTITGAYPPYNKAPRTIEQLRRDDCVENLNAYREATISWAADTSAAPGAVPTIAVLLPYLRYERLCPTGGVYTFAAAGQNPTCSRETLAEFPHALTP